MTEEQDFKVVDKRHSSTSSEESPKSGDGFVMKECEESKEGTAEHIDFSTLILSFATGALIHLGLAPDPVTQKTAKNLELAKQNIEILEMLQGKTKNNLSPEEGKLLDSLLMEARVRYVEAVRK